MTKPKQDKVTEIVDKLCGANCFPCCKVCACTNGKKMWCACHRKQLKDVLSKAIKEERLRIEKRMMDEIDTSDPKVHEIINKVYKAINNE